MSFLGSIGHLMLGTCLQELLEVIFAGNTVSHILSGKAVVRSIRGHMLLHTLLLCNVFETKLSLSSDNVPVELDAIADPYDDLVSSKTTMQDVESSVELHALQMKLDMFTETLQSKYLTAKLWLEYMEIVNIMRAFIRSKRTCYWSLRLRTQQDMLPYLAASGHNLYTKFLYVYLKQIIIVRKHASRCSQAVHSRNACHQEERSLLGKVVSRPCDRTGAY